MISEKECGDFLDFCSFFYVKIEILITKKNQFFGKILSVCLNGQNKKKKIGEIAKCSIFPEVPDYLNRLFNFFSFLKMNF